MKKPSFAVLDKLFSFFALLAIGLLAVYMCARIGVAGSHFLYGLLSGELLSIERMDAFSPRALHSIAEVIVLIKAYRVLVSYVRTHHVSVEYIVEISIIASAVELLFALDTHSLSANVVLAIYGLTNLFLYLYYFGPHHDMHMQKAVRKKRS